jgi:hypothetical protein
MAQQPKAPSREFRIYLALWRRAYAQRNSDLPLVSVTASCYTSALAMRRGMYRAIQPYREETTFDRELYLAAEAFVIGVVKPEDEFAPQQVVFRPRVVLSELEAELESLGLTEADLLLPSEVELEKELTELQAPGPETKRSTPFYTRED